MPTELQRPHRAAVLVIGMLALTPVAGAEGLSLAAAQSVQQQDNLFRLADDLPTPAGLSREDRVDTRSVEGAWVQRLGRQRLALAAQGQERRHERNPAYDTTQSAATATLDWQTVGQVAGTLGYSRYRSLQAFTDELQSSLRPVNVASTRLLNGNVDLPLDMAWTLTLSGERREVDNSAELDAARSRDLRQRTQGLRVGWRSRAGTQLGLSVARGSGEYPRFARAADGRFVADRFDTESASVDMAWEPAAAGTLRLRLGTTRNRHTLRAARDFSGRVGAASWTSRAGQPLVWTVSLQRESGLDSPGLSATASAALGLQEQARVVESLRLAGALALSGHLKARFDLSADRRDVSGGSGSGQALTGVDERGEAAGLGLSWTPRGWGQLGCEWRTEHRRAAAPQQRQLSARTLGCDWRLMWS